MPSKNIDLDPFGELEVPEKKPTSAYELKVGSFKWETNAIFRTTLPILFHESFTHSLHHRIITSFLGVAFMSYRGEVSRPLRIPDKEKKGEKMRSLFVLPPLHSHIHGLARDSSKHLYTHENAIHDVAVSIPAHDFPLWPFRFRPLSHHSIVREGTVMRRRMGKW